jgi:hypothetical protein
MSATRDEIKHLAQEHGISIGAMIERIVKYWNDKAKEEN